MKDDLRIDHDGDIQTITLNRPARANALTLGMMQTLCGALTGQQKGAVVLRSSGHDFCTGVDLGLIGRDPVASAECFFDLLQQAAAASFPLVAAIRGRAHGGGWLLAACADLVVAHPDSTFHLPELRMGVPPFSAVSLLRPGMGESLWCRAVAVGETIDARTLAMATGMILSEEPELTADALASTLAHGDGLAFAATKAFARRAMLADLALARLDSMAHLNVLLAQPPATDRTST